MLGQDALVLQPKPLLSSSLAWSGTCSQVTYVQSPLPHTPPAKPSGMLAHEFCGWRGRPLWLSRPHCWFQQPFLTISSEIFLIPSNKPPPPHMPLWSSLQSLSWFWALATKITLTGSGDANVWGKWKCHKSPA